MKLERVLELAENAPSAIHPPQDLIAFTRESLQKSLSENQLKKHSSLFSEYREQLVNFATSEFIKTKRKVRTLKDIMTALSPEWIRDIIWLTWLRGLEPSRPNEPLDYPHFIQHSALMFYFSQGLKSHLKQDQQKKIGLYALLARIYGPVLSRHAPELYLNLVEKPQDSAVTTRRSHSPQFSPYEVSQHLLERWGFPVEFSETVLLLANPGKAATDATTAKLVGTLVLAQQLADWYLQENGVTFDQLHQTARQFLRLPEKELFEALRQHLTSLPQFLATIGMDIPGISDPLTVLLRDKTVIQKKLVPYEDIAAAYLALLGQAKSQPKPPEPPAEAQFVDKTTGVFNHTYFHVLLQNLIAQSLRYEFPLSIILLDIDEFKLLNEVHSHLVGDAILQQMAQLLSNELRKADVICRTGPDEFGIILSHTGRLHAHHVAEKIRRKIEQHTFLHPTRDITYPVTVSVAYATLSSEGSFLRKNDLLEATRRALIRAKIRGGNQCLEGKLG